VFILTYHCYRGRMNADGNAVCIIILRNFLSNTYLISTERVLLSAVVSCVTDLKYGMCLLS
jgi:hypothetical protein